MKIKLNTLIIATAVIVIATTIFVVLPKNQKPSVTPSQKEFVRLSNTVFSTPIIIPNSGVLVRYPGDGFYELGAKISLTGSNGEVRERPPQEFIGTLFIAQDKYTTNEVDKLYRSGKLISVYVGVSNKSTMKEYPTAKDYMEANGTVEELATGKEITIGDHRFFVVSGRGFEWTAVSYGVREIVFVSFTASQDDQDIDAGRQRNENIFLDFLAYLQFE